MLTLIAACALNSLCMATDAGTVELTIVDALPFSCDTDSDCESMEEEFGCEYSEQDHLFVCDAPTFRRAMARHSS